MVEVHVITQSVRPEGTVGTLGAGEPLLWPMCVSMTLPIFPPLEGLATGWTYILNWMSLISVQHQ